MFLFILDIFIYSRYFYSRYESYSRPTIHPTVNICILKNLPESPPRGGFVVSSGLNHTLEEGEYEPFCAHQEQNLIHAARNLNTRTLNNRTNEESLLHDSMAW